MTLPFSLPPPFSYTLATSVSVLFLGVGLSFLSHTLGFVIILCGSILLFFDANNSFVPNGAKGYAILLIAVILFFALTLYFTPSLYDGFADWMFGGLGDLGAGIADWFAKWWWAILAIIIAIPVGWYLLIWLFALLRSNK